MQILMLRNTFGADRTLYAAGTQYDVADAIALTWIGTGAAQDVGSAREDQQGTNTPALTSAQVAAIGSSVVGVDGTVKVSGGGGGKTSQNLRAAIDSYKAGLRTRPPIIYGIGDSNFAGQGAGASGTGNAVGAFALAPMQKIAAASPKIDGLTVINTMVWGEGNMTGNAGITASVYDPRITLAGTMAPSAAPGNLGGRYYQATDATGSLTINFGRRVDVVEVYYAVRTTFSSSIQIKSSDGTVIQTFSSVAGGDGIATISVSSAKFNDGIVVIQNNAAATCAIFGVVAYPTNEPVILVGHSGWASARVAQYALTTAPWAGVLMLSIFKPDMTIVALIINDTSDATAGATYAAGLTTVLDTCIRYGGDLVVANSLPGGFVGYTNGTYSNLELQLKKTSSGYAGVGWCEVMRRFVDYTTANAAGYMRDDRHGTESNYTIQGAIFAAYINGTI